MARVSACNVKPSLSDDARDKPAGALTCWHDKLKQGTSYEQAPMYLHACWDWFESLAGGDQEACRTLADVVGSAHKNAEEGMATSLPPAPRCPL